LLYEIFVLDPPKMIARVLIGQILNRTIHKKG
jgi:hypothetical protein